MIPYGYKIKQATLKEQPVCESPLNRPNLFSTLSLLARNSF
jgi:hypothetical protein